MKRRIIFRVEIDFDDEFIQDQHAHALEMAEGVRAATETYFGFTERVAVAVIENAQVAVVDGQEVLLRDA